ncbi:hypothetical protein AKJ09_08945 [Labilithrix luteola]|uniref:Lipoprotein n=1 Tax=Labilithrix luteola TaxID=1391654 RepID=A0A0K1Q9E7_9BACT|nr:hypothetical protein [Labilithrix luteola]AKV02282.1 hypothetical protein AKJ09_08945 [Labilithrix luteola]
MRAPLFLALVAAGVALVVMALAPSGCSSPDATLRVDAGGPDRASFKPVANMLGHRCGSLDCHGSRYRNLRLYGYGGLRLDPTDRPDFPQTTDAEADADYEAVVGLEPEIMPEVVASKGADANRLTLVRKATGQEAHKGGQRIAPGDSADTCLLSWLGGAVDTQACNAAVLAP